MRADYKTEMRSKFDELWIDSSCLYCQELLQRSNVTFYSSSVINTADLFKEHNTYHSDQLCTFILIKSEDLARGDFLNFRHCFIPQSFNCSTIALLFISLISNDCLSRFRNSTPSCCLSRFGSDDHSDLYPTSFLICLALTLGIYTTEVEVIILIIIIEFI